MKKLFLALPVLGSVIGTLLTVLAYQDRRNHDWNDDYWHHHHYGYWHGERGYWRYRDHKHELIRVGPEFNGFRARVAEKGITSCNRLLLKPLQLPVLLNAARCREPFRSLPGHKLCRL